MSKCWTIILFVVEGGAWALGKSGCMRHIKGFGTSPVGVESCLLPLETYPMNEKNLNQVKTSNQTLGWRCHNSGVSYASCAR